MKKPRNQGRALIIIPIFILIISVQAAMILKLTADQRLVSQSYAKHNNKYFLARSGVYKAVDVLNEIALGEELDENFYLQISKKLIHYCTYVAVAGVFHLNYALEFYNAGQRRFAIEVTLREDILRPEVFFITAHAKEETELVGSKVEAEVRYNLSGQIEIKSLKEVE